MRVAVVGLGLIGGSLALACRERAGADVRGFDVDPAVRQAASKLDGLTVDEEMSASLAGADAVFLAAPVGALPTLAREALEIAGPECVVSDVGSTKRAICELVDDPRFIGGHPLAGAETAGIAHARADLFDGALWYLTPRAGGTTGVLYERLHRLIGSLGARPLALDAAEHDTTMAAVSHVPHVLANALVTEVAGALAGEGGAPLAAVGPSLRDATRVAGSNSAIWGDIYVGNRDAIAASLERLERALADARELISAGERGPIVEWNDAARRSREMLLATAIGGEATQELRASVPNRPGVVAEIALALGAAGINIFDLVLSPSLDGSQGVVALWVSSGAAERAEELIVRLGLPVARP